MSTDKTLADVQPGGRVRLGDQAELDRLEFQAWAHELLPCPFCGNGAEFVPYKDNGLTLKCKSMGCIQRNQRTLRYGIDWLRTSMAEHWNTRALSAQPSPGGQADDLAVELLATELERDGNDQAASAIRSGDTTYGMKLLHAALRAITAALAARQPVGEPFGYCVDFDPGAHEFAHTFYYLAPGEKVPAGCTPFFAAPPAQAVDLPYSLDADPAGIRARVCDVITGTLMVGAQGHTPPPVGHWAEPFWQAARADAKAQAVDLEQFRPLASYVIEQAAGTRGDMHMLACQLLALIDSRAAGNG